MSLTRVFPAMMLLESDTTFWVTSNTAITISKVLLMSHTETAVLKIQRMMSAGSNLRHVVVLGDHLDQLITGDEGQDDACNGYTTFRERASIIAKTRGSKLEGLVPTCWAILPTCVFTSSNKPERLDIMPAVRMPLIQSAWL